MGWRFRAIEAVVAVAALLGAMVFTVAPTALAAPPSPVMVMLDTGEGKVRWVTLSNGTPSDALNATRAMAQGLGITLRETPAGRDIVAMEVEGLEFPDTSPDGPYWHLLKWDQNHWTFPDLPARDLKLLPGDVLGWYYTTDDPRWSEYGPWLGPWPLATPTDRAPVAMEGYDLGNTGLAPGGPSNFRARWSRATNDSFTEGGQPLILRGLVVSQGARHLWAFDRANGRVAWYRPGLGGAGSIVAYNNSLYVLAQRGGGIQLYRLNLGGDTLWNRTLSSRPVAAPRTARGLLLLPLQGSLLVVDAATGGRSWEFRTGDDLPSTPVVVGDRVVVGLTPQGGVTALDLANGTSYWSIHADPSGGLLSLANRSVMVIGQRGGLTVDPSGHVLLRWEGPWTSFTTGAYDNGDLLGVAGVPGAGIQVVSLGPEGETLWRYPDAPAPALKVIAAIGYITVLRGDGAAGRVDVLDTRGNLRWSENLSFDPTISGQAVMDVGGLSLAGADGIVRGLTAAAEIRAPANDIVLPLVFAAGLGVVTVMVVVLADRRRRRLPPP